ncbi:MAG: amino acid permease, partial [Gemmatimonadetes bacterium]
MSDPAPGAASGAPPADEGLERAIRLPHATAMVAGTIIGASIFVQPSEVTGSVPTPAGAALVWTAAGVLTLLGALVTAELAALLPRSGGVYVFLREGIGAWLGFLWGWAMFWVMHTGIIAAVAMIFARYTGFLMPLGPAGTTAVALAAVAALSAVNYAGVRYGANLQALFTLVKVAAIVLIVAVGFALGGDGQGAAAPAVSGAASQGLWGGADAGDFMLALMAGLFAFGGWHMVTYNAGETVDPERTIPRALAWGVAVVTLCYVALNAVYFRVLPIETVVASDRVAADAAEALLGRPGGVAVTVL